MIEARTTFGSPIFREIVISSCWIIWTTRNSMMFDNGSGNLRNCKTISKRSLVSFVSKPSKVWRGISVCGNSVTVSIFPFSFFGLNITFSMCFVVTLCNFLYKQIDRGPPLPVQKIFLDDCLDTSPPWYSPCICGFMCTVASTTSRATLTTTTLCTTS